jgi:lysophospholipase L1-like esterase
VVSSPPLTLPFSEDSGDGRGTNNHGILSPRVMPDLLHLSAAGHRRWAEAILPTLETWWE